MRRAAEVSLLGKEILQEVVGIWKFLLRVTCTACFLPEEAVYLEVEN